MEFSDFASYIIPSSGLWQCISLNKMLFLLKTNVLILKYFPPKNSTHYKNILISAIIFFNFWNLHMLKMHKNYLMENFAVMNCVLLSVSFLWLFKGDMEQMRVFFFYHVMTCRYLYAPMVAVAIAGVWTQCLYMNSGNYGNFSLKTFSWTQPLFTIWVLKKIHASCIYIYIFSTAENEL